MKKRTVLVGMLAALTMFAAGCGGKDAAKESKVLRAGTEPTFAPFEFQEKDSKDFTGFDMDLIRAIGKQMGRDVEIKNMGFDALIPAINSVRNDENNIKSLKDLEGKTISVQIGTTGADKAASVPGAKVKTFNTNAEVFLELNNKNADAVVIDRPVGAYFLTKEGKGQDKIVGETMDAEPYGFAVKKDSKLAGEINKALGELKKNGEYDKIYKKWFGEAPKEK